MHNSIWITIIGMAIATYIPRMLPFVFLSPDKIPPLLQRILKNVPYAALGALIFPGILFIQENMWFGVIGGLVALAAAYLGAHLVLTVISAVLVLSLLAVYF